MTRDAPSSVLVLSPHQDDAAVSLGLTLSEAAQAGVEVHVLNAFTVSAHAPHAEVSSRADVSQARAEEDAAFFCLFEKMENVLSTPYFPR